MAPISIDVEVASTVPAGKLFKGFFLEIDSILLKVLPQVVASIDVQGDGGVGTIKHVTLKDVGAGKVTSMTQRIDAIDKEAMTFSYSIIAGDVLLGKLESVVNHFTVVPTGEGCILKNTTVYNPIGNEVIPEENIKEAGAFSELIFKSVEAHILANLDAY